MTDRAKQDAPVEVTDGRKHPFFVLDNDLIAIYGPKIGVYGVAVYNVLAYYANKKDMAWPSYQTIADHLGISRPKVVTTINALIACGLVQKQHRYSASGDKTSNNYTLTDIHKNGSKQDLPRSKRHLPPSKPQQPPSKQDLPQGSKPHITRGKRRLHEQDPLNNTQSSEQDPLNKNTATQPAMQEKPLTPQQAMYGAICEALGWDYKTITEDDKVRVAQAVKVLMKANYTVEDIRRFMVEIWFHDWRWEKNQQRPSLSQLRQDIGKLRAITPEHVPRVVNGSGVPLDKNQAAADQVRSMLRAHGKEEILRG